MMNYPVLWTMLISILLYGQTQAQSVSLRDKIGQMLIMGFDGSQVDKHSAIIKSIQKDNIGGVILFDYNQKTGRFDKNIDSPEQVRQLNSALQQANTLAEIKHNRPLLPLFIAVDYEGGERGTRLTPTKGFPATVSAANIGQMSVPQVRQIADAMAATLQDSGFNLNFAPVVDVNVNPNCPIIGKVGRSFSADPYEVANYASLYAQSYLAHKVQCAYKHFPGHGSATADSHLGFVDVSATWQPEEWVPYEQLLYSTQSCGMIMTAHLVNRQLDDSGLPATLSHTILTELLRNKLNFKGVIITDDMQMKAISEHYSLEQALTLAVNAGVDMLIFGNQLPNEPQDPTAIIDIIAANVRSGKISKQRINEAYQHIVTMKAALK